jgi:predicted O-methyltransferase YrrM
MGEAGGPGCRVDTIEAVAEHADLASDHLSRRHLSDRVQILRGEAKDLLPTLAEPYDLVFLDADWEGFPSLLPDLVRLTRPGGLLVSANLFPLFAGWAKEMPNKEAVEEYLTRLVRDRRMVTFIVPEQWHALSYRL